MKSTLHLTTVTSVSGATFQIQYHSKETRSESNKMADILVFAIKSTVSF